MLRRLCFVPLLVAGCLDIGDTESKGSPHPDAGADAAAEASVDAGADASGGSAGSAGAGTTGNPIKVENASNTETSTADVPTLTLTPSPSAGNAIIVGISCMSTVGADCIIGGSDITDDQGNNYALAVQSEAITSSSQGARGYIFIAHDIVVSGQPLVIIVDPEGSVPPETQHVTWGAIEVAGLAASSVDTAAKSPIGAATSTTVATTQQLAQANELAVGLLTMRSLDTNMLITPISGWTSHHIHQNGGSDALGHSLVSLVLSSTEIFAHTWTHDAPTRGTAAVLATFKGVEP